MIPFHILVAFDELNMLSEKGFESVTRANQPLLRSGYTSVHTDQQTDFLYLGNRV